MEAWLEYVVKGLVDRPGAVTVTPVQRSNVTHYEVRLHPEDVGKVIGKQGATIHALRSLLQVGCAKKGIHGALDIVEEPLPPQPPAPEPEPAPEPAPAPEPPPAPAPAQEPEAAAG
jgi:hypothetical protein